jgi:hypothetical protein
MWNDATVISVSDASYVAGPVTKKGIIPFTFPIGNNGYYAPATISAPATITDVFQAQYLNTNPDPLYDNLTVDATLNHVSGAEYWIINRTNGSSNVNVTLYWNSPRSGGVGNLTDMRVARWDGTTWKDHGNGATTGTTAAGSVTSSSPVTSFSPFTLGTTTTLNALPVELLNFNATLTNNTVKLQWQTASEQNNDYFTVQRSKNGTQWAEVAILNGAGNTSSISNYISTDKNPLSDISYYRLKQTDFDGTSTFSDIKSITNQQKRALYIYPNPTQGLIQIKAVSNELNELKVFSASGKDITQKLQFIINKTESITLDLSNLPAGLYYIKTKNTATKVFKK